MHPSSSRDYLVLEIASLCDATDFLEEWPRDHAADGTPLAVGRKTFAVTAAHRCAARRRRRHIGGPKGISFDLWSCGHIAAQHSCVPSATKHTDGQPWFTITRQRAMTCRASKYGIQVPRASEDVTSSVLAFYDFDEAASFEVAALGSSFAVVAVDGEHRTQKCRDMLRAKPHAPYVPSGVFIHSRIPPECLWEATAADQAE